mmetsp:Transcript_18613/g.34504  ORF Transcript_18613/g.34504 Transcript_18613/m.34504 type:complete len:233 (+) Transcript_18613:262-960(+)
MSPSPPLTSPTDSVTSSRMEATSPSISPSLTALITYSSIPPWMSNLFSLMAPVTASKASVTLASAVGPVGTSSPSAIKKGRESSKMTPASLSLLLPVLPTTDRPSTEVTTTLAPGLTSAMDFSMAISIPRARICKACEPSSGTLSTEICISDWTFTVTLWRISRGVPPSSSPCVSPPCVSPPSWYGVGVGEGVLSPPGPKGSEPLQPMPWSWHCFCASSELHSHQPPSQMSP